MTCHMHLEFFRLPERRKPEEGPVQLYALL